MLTVRRSALSISTSGKVRDDAPGSAVLLWTASAPTITAVILHSLAALPLSREAADTIFKSDWEFYDTLVTSFEYED
jgi:hypothetical protein